MDKLLLATTNPGKIKELKDIFKQTGVEIFSLNDLDTRYKPPVEDGKTFPDNAEIKAEYYSELTGLPCIADDSGLEVEALNFEPGVYSARYAGENATSEENNKKLINEIKALDLDSSLASYVCVLCLYDHKTGVKKFTHGICSGEIKVTPKGGNGFGYDPYFYVCDKSIAEMSMEEKAQISHRGRAAKKMLPYIINKEDKKDTLVCPNCGANHEDLVVCVPVDTQFEVDAYGKIIRRTHPIIWEEELENIRDDIEDSVEISCRKCQSVFRAEFDNDFRVVIKDIL